jgi:transposase-like protein
MPATVLRRSLRVARFRNITSEPPPPRLRCPSCDAGMTFLHHVLSLEKPQDRTYRYRCQECRHTFEYRRRTRRLRLVF